METRKPPAPPGLAARGRRFWRAVLDKWELTEPELQILAEVCRSMDEADALAAILERDGLTVEGSVGQVRVHPALPQLRGTRSLIGRLLAQLELPDVDGPAVVSPRSARAAKAAHARWSRDPYRVQRARHRGETA